MHRRAEVDHSDHDRFPALFWEARQFVTNVVSLSRLQRLFQRLTNITDKESREVAIKETSIVANAVETFAMSLDKYVGYEDITSPPPVLSGTDAAGADDGHPCGAACVCCDAREEAEGRAAGCREQHLHMHACPAAAGAGAALPAPPQRPHGRAARPGVARLLAWCVGEGPLGVL